MPHFKMILVLKVTILLIILTSACTKKSAEKSSNWTKVDVQVFDKKEDIKNEARDKRVEQKVAETRIQQIRQAMANTEEKICKEDKDCLVIEEACCSCSKNGKQVAVNYQGFKLLKTRRLFLCKKVDCYSAMSEDPSCFSPKAVCVSGLCEIKSSK